MATCALVPGEKPVSIFTCIRLSRRILRTFHPSQPRAKLTNFVCPTMLADKSLFRRKFSLQAKHLGILLGKLLLLVIYMISVIVSSHPKFLFVSHALSYEAQGWEYEVQLSDGNHRNIKMKDKVNVR